MKSNIIIFAFILIFSIISKAQNNDTTKVSKNSKNATTDFYMVEQKPEFPGGDSELMKFISDNIVYPKEAVKKNIFGKVYLSFVIDEKGNTTQVEVIRGVHPLLDEEALRVVKMLPKWIPGKQNETFV